MIGAEPTGAGVRFDVWAPAASQVEVVAAADGARSWMLRAEAGDHHRLLVPELGAGDRYWFRLDGGELLADPASRFQPEGIGGPSEVVDPAAWQWTDEGWSGPEPDGQVLYECHIGTFTRDGTFDAAISELERLAELGISAIELMPIAQFPGTRNWGYDAVFPWAVQHSYGGPAGLARFVDAAHQLGLAIILDVIYNHFGPEGNVLPRYGPYLTDRHQTPWGEAVNVDAPGSDEVRAYFIDSARAFVRDHHIDGFRLDAIHAIHDRTASTFLEEYVAAVRNEADRHGRRLLVTAESDDNDPRLIRPVASGGIGFDATWNDDVHHALRVALTGEDVGYYSDYSGAADLRLALDDGYAIAGRYSTRRGRRHGRPLGELPFQRLVIFSANHDHVGNRPAGDRLSASTDDDQRLLAAAFVLLSPYTPLLFQGEEYGETAPFPYFVDHRSAELLDAVRRGRQREFADHQWDDDVPDPGAASTFEAAILDPGIDDERAKRFRYLYRRLLGARREHPVLWHPAAEQEVTGSGDTVVLTRRLGATSSWCAFRFAAAADTVPLPPGPWHPVISTTDRSSFCPEGVVDGQMTLGSWSAVALTSG